MKTVGHNPRNPDPVKDARALLRTMNKLHGGPLVRGGVYRFKTFEEADEWMLREMVKQRARPNLKTS